MPRDISPPRTRPNDDVALVTLAQLCYVRRRLILGLGITLMMLVVGLTLLSPRNYTSTAVFMPQTAEGGLAQISGLAAQFGFTMPATEAGSSPAFYVSLLESRDVLRGAVTTRYAVMAGGDSVSRTLIDLYGVGGKTPAARRDAAVDELLADMDVTTSGETGLIHLEVSTPWSSLSKQVADRLIALVSELNLRTRQAKAGAERQFVEGRVTDTRADLRVAEDRLKAFLQRNREFRLSPELTFEHDRLRRDVQLQQQVYETLVQSYEKARIDEVRNTPGITVLVPPDLPANPDPRRTILKGLLGLLAGLAGGTFLVALRHAVAEAVGKDFRFGVTRSAEPPEERLPASLAVTAAGAVGGEKHTEV
jgi:uncharacterized protein involved in exopolysaccharide biosynthesis